LKGDLMKRSILAVGAGFVFIAIGSTLVDIVLHATGVYPPWGVPIDDGGALLATAYRLLISIIGAWLTARLAPSAPMKHALVLGVIGSIAGTVALSATWSAGLSPRWYPVALAVLAMPQCYVGALLEQRQRNAIEKMYRSTV
jgi:hypothetical protein